MTKLLTKNDGQSIVREMIRNLKVTSFPINKIQKDADTAISRIDTARNKMIISSAVSEFIFQAKSRVMFGEYEITAEDVVSIYNKALVDLARNAYIEYQSEAAEKNYKNGWIFYQLKDRFGSDVANEVMPK